MRGKGAQKPGVHPVRGITPAYAGKRRCHLVGDLHRGDHPRVCGEKSGDFQPLSSKKGSPPRMRGKEADTASTYTLLGITPAYAGKREAYHQQGVKHEDHPRVCGEKARLLLLAAKWLGSPPRMRGKGLRELSSVAHHRITPAYAGKRNSANGVTPTIWDHPRVCGEKTPTA